MGHAQLFHRIAPIYQLFFGHQVRNYNRLLAKFGHHLPMAGKALDIGCGPGGLATALYRRGYEVTGVDFAPAMIKYARRLEPNIEFIQADGRELPFSDHSFDLVTAAYVAHGLPPQERISLYEEAVRLTRGMVLLHDYSRRRNPLTDAVEWMEGGNYFSFVREGEAELNQVFAGVKIVEASYWSNWYICTPGTAK